MIRITVNRNSENRILGFIVEGHAGYDKSGQDIVCAAVSALSYTTVGALSNLAGGCDFLEEEGYMEFFRKKKLDDAQVDKSTLILDSMFIGFKQIENSYGEYIRVIEKEV